MIHRKRAETGTTHLDVRPALVAHVENPLYSDFVEQRSPTIAVSRQQHESVAGVAVTEDAAFGDPDLRLSVAVEVCDLGTARDIRQGGGSSWQRTQRSLDDCWKPAAVKASARVS